MAELTTLGLAKPTRLNPIYFERWDIEYIRTHSFEEMWDEACDTLQPGVRFHSGCKLWLERKNVIPTRGSRREETGEATYPERTLIEGQPKFI